MTRTYGEIIAKYGTYQAYQETPEGILSGIDACKSLIEEEKEKLVEVHRMYEMGETLEEINKMKDEIYKNVKWYQQKIQQFLVKLSKR
jgi:hypothetical protein